MFLPVRKNLNYERKLLWDRNQKEVLALLEGLISALYQTLVSFFLENTLERTPPSAIVLLS